MLKFKLKMLVVVSLLAFMAQGNAVLSMDSSLEDIPIPIRAGEIGSVLSTLQRRIPFDTKAEEYYNKASQAQGLPAFKIVIQEYNKTLLAKAPSQEERQQREKIEQEHRELKVQMEQLKVQHEEQLEKTKNSVDPEKIKQIAEKLISGTMSFNDLLFLYPFMIGTTGSDAIIEEGLKKTRLEIENVEKQNKDYDDDKIISPLIDFLRVPTIDSMAGSAPNLNNLKAIVETAYNEFITFKQAIISGGGVTRKFQAIYADFTEPGEFKATGKPYKFLAKLLSDLNRALTEQPINVLKLNQILREQAENIPVVFKIISDIGAEPKEKLANATRNITNGANSTLIKALEDLSKQINSKDIGTEKENKVFVKNKEVFDALQGNILLQALIGKDPTEIYHELVHNVDYFKKDLGVSVEINKETVEMFKKKATEKYSFVGLGWFLSTFKLCAEYNKVANLRLAAVGKGVNDIQSNWYCDKDKINQIVGTTIMKEIDSLIKREADDLTSPDILTRISHTTEFNDLLGRFKADFSAELTDVIRRKIEQKIQQEETRPLIDIMKVIYNAQYTHAEFVQKMHTLKIAIGTRLAHYATGGDAVESRAFELHKVCQGFDGSLSYYHLASEERATFYPLILGAFTSEKAWVKLNVAVDVHEIGRLVGALEEARAAYFVARDAIRELGPLFSSTTPKDVKIWQGFEMNASLLAKFDPASMGGMTPDHGVQTGPGNLPGLGGPRGGPGLPGATPVQLCQKLKVKLTTQEYTQACTDFLNAISTNWEKLDYAPTLNEFLEIAMGIRRYNGTVADFKIYLMT